MKYLFNKSVALMAFLAGFAWLSSGLHAQEAVEEVVVTGIKGSLQSAAAIKENADGVVEAITAEDVGKFPDVNVAESLQRVPGIAVSRNRGGEGRFVNIRGLGEEFNAVRYNGRLLATENPGREFSFDNIASELVSRVDVFKSSQAEVGDGSIGGTVNVITAKPLDKPGFTGAWSVSGNHDDLIDDNGFKFSGVLGNSFANDTFGVLASFIYAEHDFRVDTAESIDTFTGDVVMDDTTGDTSIVSPGSAAPTGHTKTHENVRWNSFAASKTVEERERYSGTLAFQWQPSDDLDITADFLYTKLESPGLGQVQTNYFCDPGCSTLSNIEVADNNIVTQFDADFTAEFLAREQQGDSDTFQFGLNGVWQAQDNLELEGDFSYSKAEATRDNYSSDTGSGSFYVVGIRGSKAEYRYNGGEVPDFAVTVPSYTTTNPVGDPNNYMANAADTDIADADIRLLGAHFTRDTSGDVEDEIYDVKLDGVVDFGDDNAFKFGFDFTDRNKTNKIYENPGKWCRYFCGHGFSLRGLNPQLFDSEFAGVLDDEFLSGSNANIPRNFITFSTAALRRLYASVNQGDPILDSEGNQITVTYFTEDANGNGVLDSGEDTNGNGVLDETTSNVHDFQAVDAQGNRLFTINDGSDILKPELRLTTSTDITEKVIGGYGQLNLNGEVGDRSWSGNVGLRVAYTEMESKGHTNVPTGVADVGAGNQAFTFSNNTPRNVENDYYDFLPSLNLRLDITENFVGRFGFSETITRPTLTDLSTASDITGTNLGQEAITEGNPELGPTRSNNIDLSLEWYGDNNQAAVAFFYKDISDFIANQVSTRSLELDVTGTNNTKTIDFEVTRPENGETAEVEGIELAYTHFFDSGFGFQGNVTWVDSEATLDGVTSRLENVSDLSYNFSVFYEAHNISARLSYNSRGDYIRTTNGKQGLSEIVDDYNQLDLTASYRIPLNLPGAENMTVFFEGVNLTDETEFVYYEGSRNLLRYYEERGRRFYFGVRSTF